jgi:hypothetical protein
MNFLLRLKHWQLFSLLIGLPLVFQVSLFISILSHTASTLTLIFGVLIVALVTFVYFGWFGALGNRLFPKLPEGHGLILNRFKIFLLIPIVYISAIILYMCITIGFIPVIDSNDTGAAFLLFIIPIHLFSMFCIFYSLYFVSKSLKMVELQRPITFNDYAGEFFLIWFFPIGIWFIQPRINNIFKANT